MSKKRVLVVCEFSELSTGFATYMKYILPRLYATGKYELAEHAIYINNQHPGIDNVPWKVYPNQPDPKDQAGNQLYNSNKINQFGMWKFDEICLDFKPDVVLSISDPWMSNWITRSAYRRYFKFIHMPTCDGQPQKIEWLQFYKECDRILTYSHWAKNVLEEESGGAIKVFSVASPGTDIKGFIPIKDDKAAIKQHVGIAPDSFIVQTVMRNQPRKLFPELFKAFARFLEICKEKGRDDIARKTFLYCHTSYPDLGWDLPMELRRYGISNKVYFTYICQNCQSVYTNPWRGDVAVCKNCNQHASILPNTVNGVSREVLAKIMGMADLYIQYSITEGWAMPPNDAKSCGVPCMMVEYSAMTEQANAKGGIPIKVERMFQESLAGTNQWRALPDIEDTAQKLFSFFTDSQENRDALGREARECVEAYYNWDDIAKIWEAAIDTMPVAEPWTAPARMIRPNLNIPNNLTNEQFVEWCYKYVLDDPNGFHSEMAAKAIAGLNLGYEMGQDAEGRPFKNPLDRQIIINHMLNGVQQKNQMEQYRYNLLVGGQGQKKLGYVEI